MKLAYIGICTCAQDLQSRRIGKLLRFYIFDFRRPFSVQNTHQLAFCDGGPYLKKYSKLVVHQTVFKEEAVLVCSKAFFHKEVKGNFTFEHLSSLPHSDYRPDRKVINLWYDYHFGKVPASLDLRLSASQVNAMIQAALAGIGLVFIPAHLIQAELKSKKLVSIPTKKSAYVNPIVLVQKADKVPSLLEKKFISKFIG